jgi:O-antigen biosynthesis protein
MSFRRRAGAPRLIDWTGERCVPWAPDIPVVYEHLHRYLWAAGLVAHRRVLDLGSGEGFGAAILADSADAVVGLDVDEQTVEHSRLNYTHPNLRFELGTALDLSAHQDGTFGAVVAFEIIEHVHEQDKVLAEIARVLSDDGILVMSTPDRFMYGEAREGPNVFHLHELTLEEFDELLGAYFPHRGVWGQRTITGSHLNAIDRISSKPGVDAPDFFIERSGDEWRLAGDPAPLYCVALASRAPLPPLAASSTLADCGLELMRVKERELFAALRERQTLEERQDGEKHDLSEKLEHLSQRLERERRELVEILEEERAAHRENLLARDRQARDDRTQRDEEVATSEERATRLHEDFVRYERTFIDLRESLASAESQLASARQANQRVAESVTWQAFQKLRSRLYRAIGGERSLPARGLSVSLRVVGRGLTAGPSAAPEANRQAVGSRVAEVLRMPGYENPQVSLIIPVHAHAELTRACLYSIKDLTTHVRYEVILVDDTADAETRFLLDGVRGAKILRNEENMGFLRSMVRGASVARGDWLVLFNNDTEVTPGWLRAMLDCAESAPDVGVVTPKFIYPDGTLNEAGGIVWRDGTAMNYGRGDQPSRFQYEYRRETDYGSAAALMVNAAFWKDIGGFDERYVPIYYEDTDLCFAARERNLRVLYEPEAVVVHVEGATSGTDLSSGIKRYQEDNRKKFVRKWRGRLESEHRPSAPANARVAADRSRGQHVLVIDHRVPMPDRDSGSLRMLGMMKVLIGLGARVTFMPENLAPVEPYTRVLQRLGIEVLYGDIDVKAEIAAIGPSLSTAILCRPHPTSHWLDTVREFAPAATVAYDTVDLHWVREARRGASSGTSDGFVSGNGTLDLDSMTPKAKALRELELAMIRATDVTLVVSAGERDQVERDVPGATALVVPNVHDVASYVPPPDRRSGILFVGGFEHVPNIDAALRLVNEVMPLVWSELRGVRVTIVGPSAPPEVQALASPLVDVAGWVEDIEPLLQRARVLVAPLRYGAGLKGKVTQCLAVGLPVVTTSIGGEGLVVAGGSNGAEEPCLLIADSAHDLARETVRLYTDDDLWTRISRSGQSSIRESCSTEVVSERLSELLVGHRGPAAEVSNDEALRA